MKKFAVLVFIFVAACGTAPTAFVDPLRPSANGCADDYVPLTSTSGPSPFCLAIVE